MAFLLIVQVPYDRQNENKLEQEITKLVRDDTVEIDTGDKEQDAKSGEKEETGSDKGDIDSGQPSPKDDDSSPSNENQDKSDEKERQTDESNGSTQEENNTETATDKQDEEKQTENNTEDITKSSEDNVNKPVDDVDKQMDTEAKPAENETKASINSAENLDNNDDKTESVDKLADESKEPVSETTSEEKDKEEEPDVEESNLEKDENDDNEADDPADSDTKDVDEDKDHVLTPLLPALPLYKLAEDVLISLEVDNYEVAVLGKKKEKYIRFSFIEQDSLRCETILNKLKAHGVGREQGSSVSVFPASLHESTESVTQSSPTKTQELSDEQQQEESQFKKSIKSRLVVAQVVASVRSNALFTFDYLLLLILASLIACLGLAENSSVILVASMLISPLMGPILAGTFGQVIKMKELRNLGVKSELVGLSLCVLVGFVFGLISGGIGLNGAVWGSTDEWPTAEMKSRGMLRSLLVGVLIALPSGAGVAISVLGGNAGSLVGVAISASLLPPACNAGMLWAYAFLAAISPPTLVESAVTIATTIPATKTTENFTVLGNTTTSTPSVMTSASQLALGSSVPESCLPLANNAYRQMYSCNVASDAALLGLISLLLTLLNITCILIMGILVLKIKEVAPRTAGSMSSVDNFWVEDVQVARTYYQTSKGKDSNTLGKEFLQEWQKIKEKEKLEKKGKQKLEDIDEEDEEEEDEDTASLSGQIETINIVKYISDVEKSSDIQHVLSKLSPASPQEPVSAWLSDVYNLATANVEERLAKRPAVYLAEAKVKDKLVNNTYHTIHGSTGSSMDMRHKPTLNELRNRLTRPTRSLYFDSAALELINEDRSEPDSSRSAIGLVHPSSSTSRLLNRRKKKVKFQVTKVEEQSLLA